MSRHTKTPSSVLPLGALAAGLGLSLLGAPASAQTDPSATTDTAAQQTLPAVTVKARRPVTSEAVDSYQTTTSTIGKGKQALRDIPQSVTVVTEKLIDDRNLDTLKEALKNTAGITFLAAEGGEEDIRLRGFSLAGTGDIFVDGMRDPAFYERDTFNLDRLEVLRGSASMLFGRGSTGGAVNQVNKSPYLMNAHEVSTTLGKFNYGRVVGDFNFKLNDEAAVRFGAMYTKADNNGAGSSIDKSGVSAAIRWGIGTADEFQVSLYHLDNRNGMNYGMPWIRSTTPSTAADNTLIRSFDPSAYYGLDSDYNHGSATLFTATHTHRFSPLTELRTAIRQGSYTRDQRASTVRFCTTSTANPDCPATAPDQTTLNGSTLLTRGNQVKIQNMEVLMAQSDLSTKFHALGFRHELITGVDYAAEQKKVYSALTAVTKPRTTVDAGSGGWVDEASRTLGQANAYESTAYGLYAQNLVQIAPAWKLLAGVRFDRLKGDYTVYTAATGAVEGTYDQTISEWSRRFGVLFQPTPYQSYHLSYGTSFNTSGDTYSYAGNASARERAANTPPESSENIELGAKLDWAEGRYTTRLALFHAVKKNERNTDATSVTDGNSYLLSAQRHSTGFEVDLAGKITPAWEIYGSYTWIPDAQVDKTASANSFGNREGDRPGLIPVHSGTVWTTYQLHPQWRVGGGINFRSSQAPADITNPQSGTWKAPGFHTIDLMAEYVINSQFTVKANLTNLENTLYADSLYRGHYIPGPGRNFQVELVAKF